MSDCPINKIDSNITSLAYAEEECLKQLPASPIWYNLEPNEYSDFGGDYTRVSAEPISASRQRKKGNITDLDASGGINQNFTVSNMTRLLQGFLFADAREPSSTAPINGAQIAITAVNASTKTYTLASGGTNFVAGQIIFAEGFANASNNGLKTVVSSTATTVVVSETLVDETTPPSAAKFNRVGGQLLLGDVNFAVVDGIPSIISTITDFTTFPNFIPGNWLFLGGDDAASRFANNVGYVRIKSVSAKSVSFDDTTFSPSNESGTGKSIKFFAGVVIKNEKERSLIKQRSYTFERQLGEGATSTQAEYLTGAVASELTLNLSQAELVNIDISYTGCDMYYRTGEAGDEILTGTRLPVAIEDPYNTASNVYRFKMNIKDKTSSNPDALFAYISEGTITVNNNLTANKAIGILGAFDISAGQFEVGGSVTAYFQTVEALRAIRNNADIALNAIFAHDNKGFIFDIPLLGCGGGRLDVAKDEPVMLPLEPAGEENENGYTLLYVGFNYLPNIAMPQ